MILPSLALSVALLASGCPDGGTETQIEYRETPCTDPLHGSSCNGDHTHIHDNCGNGGCSHDVYDCNNAVNCYRSLTLALKQAREEGSTKCAAAHCKKGEEFGVCDTKIATDFRNKAFDIWSLKHRSTHDVTYNPSPNGSANTVATDSMGRAMAPCLKPSEIQEAKQAALDAMQHSY